MRGHSTHSAPFVATVLCQEKSLIEAALHETVGRIAGTNGTAAKVGILRTTLEAKISGWKSTSINLSNGRGTCGNTLVGVFSRRPYLRDHIWSFRASVQASTVADSENSFHSTTCHWCLKCILRCRRLNRRRKGVLCHIENCLLLQRFAAPSLWRCCSHRAGWMRKIMMKTKASRTGLTCRRLIIHTRAVSYRRT